MSEPARDRLRRFLAKYPGATAAAAARAIGVSRQRVHQIVHEEGLELQKYVTYPEQKTPSCGVVEYRHKVFWRCLGDQGHTSPHGPWVAVEPPDYPLVPETMGSKAT